MDNISQMVDEKKKETVLDFTKLFHDLLKHKKLYFKVLSITFIVAAIILLGIPNYYKCVVKLSPEASSSSSRSGLASLASSFGVNIRGALGNTTDALYPTLYPDLMNNVDFKTNLFKIPVTIEGNPEEGVEDRTMPYYDYLKNEQKNPWWSAAIGGTLRWLVSLVKGDVPPQEEEINPFRLTKEQTEILYLIDQKINCDVDQRTMIISIEVTDQNALICATMADSVRTCLQEFITDYRTSKARVDLNYYKKLLAEAQTKYEEARDNYAAFADSHRSVTSQSAQLQCTDLQNEMNLRQQVLQQVVERMQEAEMQVQAETPAFTVIQSATVPVIKSGPSRAKWCIIYLFLAFLCTTVWILYKEGDISPLLGLD